MILGLQEIYLFRQARLKSVRTTFHCLNSQLCKWQKMRAVSDKKRRKHSHRRERYRDTKKRSSKDKYWIQVQHQQKPHRKTAKEFRQWAQIFRNHLFCWTGNRQKVSPGWHVQPTGWKLKVWVLGREKKKYVK